MKIFIVNGKGASGKSSFENYIQEMAKEDNINVIVTSIIQSVKDRVETLGWNGGKTQADRRFLSDLKIALTRWKDLPFILLCGTIDLCKAENTDVLFIDMREAEDIDRIKELYEVQTVLVRRRSIEGQVYGNIADDNVFNYSYDIVIENNEGIEELKESARTFYESFIKEYKE